VGPLAFSAARSLASAQRNAGANQRKQEGATGDADADDVRIYAHAKQPGHARRQRDHAGQKRRDRQEAGIEKAKGIRPRASH
jgi:hypothetical protein